MEEESCWNSEVAMATYQLGLVGKTILKLVPALVLEKVYETTWVAQ